MSGRAGIDEHQRRLGTTPADPRVKAVQVYVARADGCANEGGHLKDSGWRNAVPRRPALNVHEPVHGVSGKGVPRLMVRSRTRLSADVQNIDDLAVVGLVNAGNAATREDAARQSTQNSHVVR